MTFRTTLAGFVILLGFSISQTGCAEDNEQTFVRATALIEPYLMLTDKAASDARSTRGKKDLHEAIGMLTRITQKNPEHWPSYWFIGKAHQALNDHPASYEAFKASLALKPPSVDVAREFVIEAICVGATDEAVAAADDVSDSNPSDVGLLANLGLALLADGQVSKARSTIEKALELAPEDQITQSLLNEAIRVQGGDRPSNYCPP